jgi:hypothetical protein
MGCLNPKGDHVKKQTSEELVKQKTRWWQAQLTMCRKPESQYGPGGSLGR